MELVANGSSNLNSSKGKARKITSSTHRGPNILTRGEILTCTFGLALACGLGQIEQNSSITAIGIVAPERTAPSSRAEPIRARPNPTEPATLTVAKQRLPPARHFNQKYLIYCLQI